MKIINKIRSMLIARRIQKTCKTVEKAWKYFDVIEKSCKLTFYIIPGFEEPTLFIVVATVDGMEIEPILQIINFGVLSASEIVEAAKMLQTVSPRSYKCPELFAVRDANMAAFLQDNGVDNVILATKEYYEKVLKEIEPYYKEIRKHVVDVGNIERLL